MVLCGFLFDIVIVDIKIGESQDAINWPALSASVAFANVSVLLVTESIRTSVFPDGKSVEFELDTDNAKEFFTENPMGIVLRELDIVLGISSMPWPEEILNKIERMTEISFINTIDLFNEEDEDESVGTIDIMVRLKPKCKDVELMETGEAFELIRDDILKNVGSKDLFFLLDQAKHLEACAGEFELLKDPEEPSVALDMSKFRDFNGQLVPTPSILNTCCSPDCQGLKKFAKGFGPKDKSCGVMNILSRNKKKSPKDSCLICGNIPSSSTHQSVLSDEGGVDVGQIQWGSYPPPRVCLDTPPPELTQTINNRPRACPLCKTNVDWLPSFTPCPKCGYKAVPRINELPYSESINAKEILRDFFFREPSSDPIDCRAAVHREPDSDECDCECQKGQTCPHCRVRKACKSLFGTKFDLCDELKTVAEPPLYSKPLQEVFCDLKKLLDNVDVMQKYEQKQQCSQILYDHEEQEIKHKLFGDPRYDACKDLETIRERMSKCKSLDPEKSKETVNRGAAGTSSASKKKKKSPRKCKFTCQSWKVRSDTKKNQRNVPRNVGWLWKLDPHTREGWKPGAIRRPIRNIMSFFLPDMPPDTFHKSKTCHRSLPAAVPERPILHVCKRNDVVYITLRPGVQNCVPCKAKPLQFIIEKSEEAKAIRGLRDEMIERGFIKCTCGRPLSECNCRNDCEMAKIMAFAMREGCRRGISDVEEKLILNNEYDSDAEYEFSFSPPRKRCIRKRRTATNGVQYNPKDNVQRKPAPVKVILNCATGE